MLMTIEIFRSVIFFMKEKKTRIKNSGHAAVVKNLSNFRSSLFDILQQEFSRFFTVCVRTLIIFNEP